MMLTSDHYIFRSSWFHFLFKFAALLPPPTYSKSVKRGWMDDKRFIYEAGSCTSYMIHSTLFEIRIYLKKDKVWKEIVEILGVIGKYTVLQLYRNKFDKRELTSANVNLVIGSREKKHPLHVLPYNVARNISGHLFTLHLLA